MRHSVLTLALPCALLLSACTTVTPAFKDIGSRSGPCVEGGPDTVAEQFYQHRIEQRSQGLTNLTSLRPYLSDSLYQLLDKSNRENHAGNGFLRTDPFSSRTETPERVRIASASRIPNTDARNIPLRVEQQRGETKWLDEVLMVREGQCWTVDDVRYLGGTVHAPAGTLRQSLERR
ncbi:lipoprotein [Cronobacter sakazakii]